MVVTDWVNHDKCQQQHKVQGWIRMSTPNNRPAGIDQLRMLRVSLQFHSIHWDGTQHSASSWVGRSRISQVSRKLVGCLHKKENEPCVSTLDTF